MSKLGLICRLDNGGLGNESIEFYKHLKPEKVLCIKIGSYPTDSSRFIGAPWRKVVNGQPTDNDIREFLTGLTTAFSVETFYNPHFTQIAREMGVQSVLKINYEWLTDPAPEADLYIAPMDWYYDNVPTPKKLLRLPVNTDTIRFKERKTAKTFVHIAGHTGVHDRNGSGTVIEAIKHVKSDARFIIYAQEGFPGYGTADSRVLVIPELPQYDMLYDAGDVMILPRKYAGQSMVLNESLAAGFPVMMTDMSPQNDILPKHWLIPTTSSKQLMIKREIECCDADPIALAAMVDDWYGKDITKESAHAKKLATDISWKTLLPEWTSVLRSC